jgi:hypothetical protein
VSTSYSRRYFVISNIPGYIRVAPLGQNRNISVQVQCNSKTKHTSGHVIPKKVKRGLCVIDTNNPPDNLFTEFDTCLDIYYLLVWLLKQQPAPTSDSIRDFVISYVLGYIRAAPLGQNRNISVQLQCNSKTKYASGHAIKIKEGLCVIETNNPPDNLFTELDNSLETYCILVWLLKQHPAPTSYSRRDIIISDVLGYIRAAPLGQNRNISVQVQCNAKTKHASGHVIPKKIKQGLCVIEIKNPPDNLFTELDTCLDIYYLLVWLLKHQPTPTSDSRRDIVISNIPGYIRAAPLGQNRIMNFI